jgi:hypothetical protein
LRRERRGDEDPGRCELLPGDPIGAWEAQRHESQDARTNRCRCSSHNRAIATQEVIEELIKLAKELDAATKRGESLGLTEDEVAFYDALAANESAVQAMGDEKLRVIPTELISQVRKSVTIDWTLRERPRKDPRDGQTYSQQVRLPAGSAGRGREDCPALGGVAVCGLGVIRMAGAGGQLCGWVDSLLARLEPVRRQRHGL